jgi:hypothetical protein
MEKLYTIMGILSWSGFWFLITLGPITLMNSKYAMHKQIVGAGDSMSG